MTPDVLSAEDRYSALSEAIPQGFCLLQVEFDAAGTPTDYRFIETNALFEAHSGLKDAVGRSARELVAGLEHFWIERYAQVARSQTPIHFEQRSDAMDRLFDVHAFPVGPADLHLVGLLFEDITRDRARQDNAAFLTEISNVFDSRLPLPEIMTSVGRRLGDHIRTNSCLFCEVDEAADTITTSYGWTRRGEPTLIRTFRISDYLSVEFLEDSRAGRTVAVFDTATDSRTDATAYAELNIKAFVTIPYYADGVWTHYFAVTDANRRQWNAEELNLLQSFARLVFSKLERMRAEVALRASEARFRTMADAVPQIVWITDSQGRVEFFNRQWMTYTGIELLPETAGDVAGAALHPDDVAETMAQFSAAMAARATFTTEHRIRSASGEYRWFMVRGEPECDAKTGAVVRCLGASVDIHDRVIAEQRLRHVANDQALQINLSRAIGGLESPDDITAIALSMLGAHLGATRVICADIVGPNSALIRRDWSATPDGSLAGVVLTMSDFGPVMIADLQAGRVVANHDVTTDERTAGHSGAFTERGVMAELVVPVLRDGQLKLLVAIHMAAPHQWQATEIGVAQAVCQQILLAAETALAQAGLRAERDLSQAIFDGMREGFALIGPDWTIQEVNEIGARIAQRTRSQMVGRNHWEVLPESIGTPVDAVYRRVLATGLHETFEYLHEPHGGDSTWVEIRAYRISTGALAVFYRDVTDRKRIEQELGDAVRRRDEFLAMLAHELRNPLAPIRAAAHVLSMPGVDEMRLKQTTDIIARQVEHMTSLVDDLLDVSRVTRGLAVLEKQRVDLKWAASSAVEQVRPLIEARRHHLTLQLPPGNAEVSGDPKRLVQILANLLNNAAKYTQEGGSILLRIDTQDGHVAVNVEDDGRGMSPDMVRRAFTLFSQAEQTSDRTQGGLGIGLALVKSLVELHDGTVSATSPGDGKGSTFRVCLPRRLEETSQARSADQSTPPHVSHPLRILVVDDNQDAARTLEMLLEASGHSVLTVYSAHAGLEQAIATPPDVCLLDIGLPEMDGNELARRLRAAPQTRDAMLIAVTGYSQDSDRKGTAAAGFDHHLVKPVDPYALDRLLASVRPHLN